MYYTLVNPSDNYTLRADSLEVAVIAALLVGDGRYGLDDEAGQQVMPVFLFDGLEEWIAEKFDKGLAELVDSTDMLQVAECLESFAICGLRDRKLYDEAITQMQPAAAAHCGCARSA